MTEILMRLCALCLCSWLCDQLLAGSRLEGGVRLIIGLTAVGLMLEAVLALPGALVG